MCNKLVLGDNLEVMKSMPSESVDLIYLDPPFFSNRNYEVIWGDKGEVRSFEDRWAGGVENYIKWLKVRVIEMHRILKSTGSIYLHCDWHADAYIRVMILDEIFGYKNFKNMIIWKRKNSVGQSNVKSKQFGYNIDTIYFYAKSKKNTFNTLFTESREKYIEQFFTHQEEDGRVYRLATLTSPSPRANLMYEYKGHKPPPKGWAISLEKMKEWDASGKIFIPDDVNKRIQRKIYLDDVQGQLVQTIWDDISVISPSSKERIGYPTQKPVALLERIIKASSNEGDIVLDPFVGGGTTIVVADELNRRWIGIDQSVQAIKVSQMRFNKVRAPYGNSAVNSYTVQLYKYDIEDLQSKDPFEFERWIITQFGGVANAKQRGDSGIDGKTADNTPIQVKQSKNIGRNVIDNFLSAVKRNDKQQFEQNIKDKKPVGFIIAFSFSKGAVEEVARLENSDKLVIKLVRVDEIIEVGNRPKLTIDFSEKGKNTDGDVTIEITATGDSKAGVEFFSWDLNYDEGTLFKPDIMRDTTGKVERAFAPGEYNIACKVVDADGLENVEIVKLRVNGFVLRV
ncbi:MAG: hypothetical protein FWG20_02670 [Candidatus Cloacimonetes bacterium]|nr:hypothetical protein [Candidatus Cloacimonadota bacterium]